MPAARKIEKFDISNCSSSAHALSYTGQNWMPIESDLYDSFGNVIESHKAIIRSDSQSIIGVVGKNYHTMPLDESFMIADTLVKEKGLQYEQLTSLDNGSKSILSLKMNEVTLKQNDSLTPRLNIVQSFDGSFSYHIFFSMMRIVCTNQLVSMMKNAYLHIRHTKTMPERVKFAETAIHSAFEYFDNMKSMSIKMIGEKINDQFRDQILTQIFGKDNDESGQPRTRVINQKNRVIELFQSGKGNAGETKWDLLNGITEYIDHYRGSDDDKRQYSSIIGSGADIKKKAFQILAT